MLCGGGRIEIQGREQGCKSRSSPKQKQSKVKQRNATKRMSERTMGKIPINIAFGVGIMLESMRGTQTYQNGEFGPIGTKSKKKKKSDPERMIL